MLQLLKHEFRYEFDSASVIAARQTHYRQLIHTVVEVKAVADIVRSHWGKVPIAVASGGERVMLEATLGAIGLRQFFDVIVSIEDVEQGKPAPDLFLLAAKRLEVSPKDCIVYEDSEGGLEAAHRDGMRAIDVRLLEQPKFF